MQLTGNTNREIKLIPGRDYTLFIAGNFGNGILTLSLANADLSGVLPIPGHETITTDTCFILTAPSHRLLLSLTESNSPNLTVDCVLCASGT